MNHTNQKGVALLVAIMFATLLALVAGYALKFSYNQTRQVDAVGIKRTGVYFRAQAGVVDAMWRIRTDTIPPGSVSGSHFTTQAFDPPAYYIDIDSDTATAAQDTSSTSTASEVKVDIGPVNASGLRSIDSTGLDK